MRDNDEQVARLLDVAQQIELPIKKGVGIPGPVQWNRRAPHLGSL